MINEVIEEQMYKAILFLKNEIEQKKVILKGVLNDEYRKHVENQTLFYEIATQAIENNLVFKTILPNMTKEDIELIEKCLKELFKYKKLGTIEEIEQKLGEFMSAETIKIKYFTDIEHVEKITQGDLIDLRAAEDVEMKAGEFKLIPLGVAMELPRGFKANVYPRSSTYKNFGIIMANSVGQIDESYCGDNDQWMFPAIAMRDTIIHKNDRICQFDIQRKMSPVEFVVVNVLGNNDRGGIGSTGKQ